MTDMRRAFTLIEVNLAIMVMAGGVLGMVALYSLGLRENSQSVEDVASAGFADAMFAPLVATLSSRDLTWSDWCSAVPNADGDTAEICNGIAPNSGGEGGEGGERPGWAAYVYKSDNDRDYFVDSGCNRTANGVASRITGLGSANVGASPPSIGNGYKYALVATRRGSTISLAFRASRRLQTLMSQPIYYTEVHFQGDPTK